MKRYNPFEKGAEKYDSWFAENEKVFLSELDAIKKVYDLDKKTIEIGVGTGIFAEALGIKYGLEPSKEMAKLGKARGIEIIESEAEEMPIADATYEQAIMITVDCFLNDVEKAFNEINRILTADGVAIIVSLNRETTLGKIYNENKNNDEIYKWAEFHSAEEIIEMLAKCGFNIKDIYQTVSGFENKYYEVQNGYGEGIFTVFKAVKR